MTISSGTTRRSAPTTARSAKTAKTAKPSREFAPATPEELEALEALGKEGVWEIGGRELKLTNLDKPLFEAEPPVTKRELIRYFATIAPVMIVVTCGVRNLGCTLAAHAGNSPSLPIE